MPRVTKKLDAGSFQLKDQVVSINRVTKVVKGGKNMSFAALVVAFLAFGLLKLPPVRGAALGLLAAAILFTIQASLAPHVPPPPSAYAGVADGDLAQAGWRILIAAGFHDDVPLLTALALPAWAALVALVVAAASTRSSHAA